MLIDLEQFFVIVAGDGVLVITAFTVAGGILLALLDVVLAVARRLG